MADFAIVRTGGKQYLVKDQDVLVVDRLDLEKGKKMKLDTLLTFSDDGAKLTLGTPTLPKQVEAEVIEHGKGEKIRVAKFKAKVRYRKVRGFRPSFSKIKISGV